MRSTSQISKGPVTNRPLNYRRNPNSAFGVSDSNVLATVLPVKRQTLLLTNLPDWDHYVLHDLANVGQKGETEMTDDQFIKSMKIRPEEIRVTPRKTRRDLKGCGKGVPSINRNSALFWLPRIEAAGMPTPRTIMVPYSHRDCLSLFDGVACPEFSRLSEAIEIAAKDIGFPVFIRTDLSSAKHSGPNAYRIDEPGENQPIFETLEDNELKFWMERDGPQAFMVREWLDLEHHFTAFGGLPISREWRYFADSKHIICSHPYWPAEALEGHVDEAAYPDWGFWLSQLHEPTGDEPELARMAIEAAKACGDGRWSVDFCRDVNGKIWLTDMAVMENSWHWPGCPNGK